MGFRVRVFEWHRFLFFFLGFNRCYWCIELKLKLIGMLLIGSSLFKKNKMSILQWKFQSNQ